VTEGIRVTVQSQFRPDQSNPSTRRYFFTYTVKILNEARYASRLVSRHWVITDANGVREDVEGEGVVGSQPLLGPGEEFEYTSFCVLKTPHGSMHGTYRMVREDGVVFDARIAPFPLVPQSSLN
jgi:ApaG protein